MKPNRVLSPDQNSLPLLLPPQAYQPAPPPVPAGSSLSCWSPPVLAAAALAGLLLCRLCVLPGSSPSSPSPPASALHCWLLLVVVCFTGFCRFFILCRMLVQGEEEGLAYCTKLHRFSPTPCPQPSFVLHIRLLGVIYYGIL
jgi:hypothetical protein